jgi:GSH-dependent disulfide-bond oxidoreductase
MEEMLRSAPVILWEFRMIDLYTWMTDNGLKPRMILEETALPYTPIPINIRQQAQMAEPFLKISPGHKIPAIVDHDGPGARAVAVFESGAILKYLAEKTGQFYPGGQHDRLKVDQWLFYGCATFTTIAQQFGHWTIRSKQNAPLAQEFYRSKLFDMMSILNRYLESSEFFGDAYSIADMSIYPDVHVHGVLDIGLENYPHLKRWHDVIEARPATQRAWQPFLRDETSETGWAVLRS